MPDLLTHVADILMIAASVGAAIYCLVLSRRLSRLTGFDSGIGGAIAVLSVQVDEMKGALAAAKSGSEGAGAELRDLVAQAREISAELELMIAACHDFAEQALVVQAPAGDGEGGRIDQPGDPVAGSAPSSVAGPVVQADAPMRVVAAADPPDPPVVFGTRRLSAPDPHFTRHARA